MDTAITLIKAKSKILVMAISIKNVSSKVNRALKDYIKLD